MRDGLLLFAREMPWGHATTAAAEGESVADRLASELRRSILFFKQTFRAPVEAVVLCGDMRNLRTLTAPLGTAIAIPVHTLDALAGLDAESVPEPADQFRAAVASLRLGISAEAARTRLAEADGRLRQVLEECEAAGVTVGRMNVAISALALDEQA